MKTFDEDDELRERLRSNRVNGSAEGDADNDYMTGTGINDDPPIDDDDEPGEAGEQGVLDDDDDLLDDEETEAEKDELDGPANDLVGQPGYDDEDDE
jgi:hypothetical protein